MVIGIPPLTQRAAGSRVTAAIYEQDITDSVGFLVNPPLFLGYQNTVQSIPNNSWTPLAIDTTTIDSYSGHSNTVNSSRYTASSIPGYYEVSGVYASASSSANFRGVRIAVNNSPILGGAVYCAPSAAGEMGVATPVKEVFLNVGDYVEIQAYQATGGPLNTQIDVDLRCGMRVRFSHA